jgi:hypothetical protein
MWHVFDSVFNKNKNYDEEQVALHDLKEHDGYGTPNLTFDSAYNNDYDEEQVALDDHLKEHDGYGTSSITAPRTIRFQVVVWYVGPIGKLKRVVLMICCPKKNKRLTNVQQSFFARCCIGSRHNEVQSDNILERSDRRRTLGDGNAGIWQLRFLEHEGVDDAWKATLFPTRTNRDSSREQFGVRPTGIDSKLC